MLLGSPIATKSPGLTPLAAKARARALARALELEPGQRIRAMTDGDRIRGLAFGIPARHVGEGDQHGSFPSEKAA
ncbi:hypothetical protein AB7M56_006891 [Bradyrhizobium elkanii]